MEGNHRKQTMFTENFRRQTISKQNIRKNVHTTKQYHVAICA